MENKFLDNKIILKYCPDYFRIINEEFSELDLMSDKVIQIYQNYIFTINIKDKVQVKRVSTLNSAVARYFDDRDFKTLLTNALVSLKVPKGSKDVVDIIVSTIIKEYEKYLDGFTRNLYIPRWI